MAQRIVMPSFGMYTAEGNLGRWLVPAGAAVIDPSRIALNPDCGFAPDAGEPPTIDEAFEKLSRLSAAEP